MPKKQQQPHTLLTTREVVTQYGISRTTLMRRVADNSLAAYLKLSGRTGAYVFTRDEIERAFGPAPARKVAAA